MYCSNGIVDSPHQQQRNKQLLNEYDELKSLLVCKSQSSHVQVVKGIDDNGGERENDFEKIGNDIRNGIGTPCALLIKPSDFETILWINEFLSLRRYLSITNNTGKIGDINNTIKKILINNNNNNSHNERLKSLVIYGICIETSMTTNDCDAGNWNIGFVLRSSGGDKYNATQKFCFHPNYNKKGLFGMSKGWKNESMGFTPKSNRFHKMKIFTSLPTVQVIIKVAQYICK